MTSTTSNAPRRRVHRRHPNRRLGAPQPRADGRVPAALTGATAITAQASQAAGAWARASRGPASRKIQLAPRSAGTANAARDAERPGRRSEQRNRQQVVEGLIERQRPAADPGGQQPRAGEGDARARDRWPASSAPDGCGRRSNMVNVKIARPGVPATTGPATCRSAGSGWRRRRGSTASITRRAFHASRHAGRCAAARSSTATSAATASGANGVSSLGARPGETGVDAQEPDRRRPQPRSALAASPARPPASARAGTGTSRPAAPPRPAAATTAALAAAAAPATHTSGPRTASSDREREQPGGERRHDLAGDDAQARADDGCAPPASP